MVKQGVTKPPEKIGDYRIERDEKGRFKPGVSGNPAGKPPGSLSLTARIKAELKRIPPGQRMSCGDVLVKRIVRRALIDGDIKMIELIWKHLNPKFEKELRKYLKLEKNDLTQVLNSGILSPKVDN